MSLVKRKFVLEKVSGRAQQVTGGAELKRQNWLSWKAADDLHVDARAEDVRAV